MKSITLLGICLILMSNASAQVDGIMARNPSVSPDGSMISFSYQGDIWTSSLDGTNSKRLTIHEGYETTPKWNNDGSKIAFTGNRFGNNDIFVINTEGGSSKRLTYHSSNDLLVDWAPNNMLLFETARVFRQVERDAEIHHIHSEGGTPSRLLDSFGNYADVSPNGRFIAHTRGNCRISREAYNGPADRDIWIYDTKNGTYTELTDNSINDFMPVWGDDNTLYFISARSGRYNIYKYQINQDGNTVGEPEQLTNFTDEGVRAIDVSSGSGIVVFERDVNLYSMTTSGGNIRKINLVLNADNRFDEVEAITYSNNVSDFDISPDGKMLAMTIRGEIFIKENDSEKNKTRNVSNHTYRDRNVGWLNDSTVVFTSDRNGQYDLYLARSSDPKKTNIFKSLKHEVVRLTNTSEDEMGFVLSPDSKKIAYLAGRGKLITADIDENGKLTNSKTLLDGWSTPGGVSWSPDSKWLAYSLSDLNFDSEVFIHAADNSSKPVNVSMHPKGDFSPVWSRDGSKLGFISGRNNGNNDIWFVWLTKEDYEKTNLDHEEGYYFEEEENDKKDKTVKIDFDDIHNRLFQLTFLPGNEGNLVISEDGETFYFSSSDPDVRGSDIYSIKFDRSDLKQVTKGGQNIFGLALTKDGKSLIGFKQGRVTLVNPSNGKLTNQPFRAEMEVDHWAEREQVFEEMWRELDKGFYDPDFHGRDWKALKAKYKPWALSASTRQDFAFVANWMLGQLNASHMGLRGGANPEDLQTERTGLLGIEVQQDKAGVKVVRVVPGSPADKEQSKLNVGDVITHVNGTEINEDINFYSTLKNMASDQVLLRVNPISGKAKEIVIQPASSLSTLLYEEYIASRKALVDKYSNGKLGYIHIRAMNFSSFERFERELKASGYGKEGIVIDVRWNGGGSTTDLLMAVLNVTQHAYTVPRGATNSLDNHKDFKEYYPLSRLPLSAWLKPSIALCNQTSYSNAEIFSHAFKNVGIGKLVGMPTFGAVISTGGSGLIDGSFVRMPFRGWFVKSTGQNMEHGPAVPDILVENDPDGKANGEDKQLKRAVEELLKDIN